ncbi:MAG TPA: S-adenosylmethionine decarboxylase [Streptosporangiaceae bacterium]|jgi:S-adenosylmethionine decarboxylase
MLGNGALSAQPAAGRPPALGPQQARPAKVLHAIDAVSSPASPVADLPQLTSAATRAVAAGRGHVLHASHVVFPNGAITLVLILAESHLSIHTWPEEDLVAVDLFSCGAIDADRVISELVGLLRLDRVSVRAVPRGLPG